MSSWPGPTMEDLLWDRFSDSSGAYTFTRVLDPELFALLVKFYEPYRRTLEKRGLDYDEDTHGAWKDYRWLCVWDGIPDPPENKFEISVEIAGRD